VRLLEYMLILFLVIVVFVPAFTLIYSPPAYTPNCPECECECPECPTFECPQPKIYGHVVIPPLGLTGWFENGDFVGELQYKLYLYPIEGFKYILLIQMQSERIMYSEWIDWDTMDVGWVDFQEYNSTHSYAYVTEIRHSFNIFGYEYWHYRDVLMLHVFIVSEDATIHDILE
jgi:hypothetical protein